MMFDRIDSPYLVTVNHYTKQYYFLNRDYKTLGRSKKEYGFHEVYPDIGEPHETFYLYDDATNPRLSQENLRRYERTSEWLEEFLDDYEEVGPAIEPVFSSC